MRFLETRSLNQFEGMEARAETTDDAIKISGRGAVFNKWYTVFGFKERVSPGAFTKTLRENLDIRGMFNHDPNFLLGRTKSGTMDVSDDGVGLAYEIRADPLDPQAQSVARKIARGDIDGSSMAFFVPEGKDEWKRNAQGRPTHRTILEVELIETGPVTMPASPSTTAKIARASQDAGIDLDALQGFIVLTRAGFALAGEQQDLVKTWIENLKRLTMLEPDHRAHHSSGTPRTPAEALEQLGAALALKFRSHQII